MLNNQLTSNDARTWITPWRFAALFAVLICATFPEMVTLRETFFYRDFGAFGYPLAAWQRDCFWRGEMPLWNPLSYCGLPFVAEWNTLTLYPLSLIYLILPIAWSLGLFCLVHFAMAGMGAYFLARRWTSHSLAATVAGIAFTFNALLLNSLMWPNNMAAFGWMPWVVLLVERAWREGGRSIVLAALAGGMQMLAGAPEVIMLTWLTLLAIWLGQFWQNKSARKSMVFRCILIVGLVAGLAAAQLLPFLDLLRYSQRHTNFGDSAWAMPWWGWAQFIVPQFRTLASPLGPRFQPEQGWVDTYYFGIGTLTLAMFAVWQVRQPRVRLLSLLACASLFLAPGEKAWVFAIAKKVIPVFGFMRYPVKFVVLTSFLAPLLAAFALRHTLETSREAWPAHRQRLFCATAGVFGIIAGILFLDYQQPYKNVAWSVTAGSGATRAALLVLIIAVVVMLRQVSETKINRRLQLALPLLLWLDVLTFAPRPNPTVSVDVYEPGLARKELKLDPAPKIGEARAMVSYTAEVSLNASPLTNHAEHVYYNRLGLMGNFNLLDDIPKIGGSYSLYFHELEQVLYLLYYSATNVPPGLTDFLSVAHITAPGKNIQWQARSNFLPWITGGQHPVFGDGNAGLAGLNTPDFNPRETVYLPTEARTFVSNTNQATVKLSAQNFGDQRITVDADASAPTLLVISQNYYHRWKPTVNQQAVPLLRANHAFQAVPIPAGHSHVELVYQDPSFKIGVLVSTLALLICGILWWRLPRSSIAPA